MDVQTAMKHHKLEVNINATIKVPLETMLAIRDEDWDPKHLEPITATLQKAAIDAIRAHPNRVGDTSSSPPLSNVDLRKADRAASEEAEKATEEMEEMIRKSLLEDHRRLKADTSKTL
ncbi:hypothetical protein AC578_6426 [Pseudocercospora eumusae]|uniref:Uncharacterized protein n=1 Tax=Pseudocercospora eumusae TaxID=321146 RepID=A0A139H6R3_9PEZI|nr:hypothetical protein AC578_6426 [Pseudocercospora eumusae]